MTPELLLAAGEALYGASWRAPLARDLGVSDRTIQRWIRGENPIPVDAQSLLLTICEQHACIMNLVMNEIMLRPRR